MRCARGHTALLGQVIRVQSEPTQKTAVILLALMFAADGIGHQQPENCHRFYIT